MDIGDLRYGQLYEEKYFITFDIDNVKKVAFSNFDLKNEFCGCFYGRVPNQRRKVRQ